MVTILCLGTMIALFCHDAEAKEPSCSKRQAIYKMAEAMFYEARDQSYKGRVAVFYVIIQRIKDKRGIAAGSNTVCEVVDQWGINKYTRRTVYQFSYHHLSKSRMRRIKKKEKAAWDATYKLAEYAYYHPKELKKTGLTGQNHYQTVKLWNSKKAPRYNKYAYNTKIIGDHIFFNLKK